MKKHIPNLFTSLNVFSGCIACVMAFNGEYFWVVFFVILSAIFDFLDGFMARLLNAYSPMGKELDSLADMVSFGLAPSLVVFRYLSDYGRELTPISTINAYLPYIAFLLAVFSALRLAKFNIDERQTSSFIGLNTPANAMFWVSLCYGLHSMLDGASMVWTYSIVILIIVFSFLMIAELPMFSFKIKSLHWKGNELRYLLVAVIVVSFIFIQIPALSIGIVAYILLSLLTYKKTQ